MIETDKNDKMTKVVEEKVSELKKTPKTPIIILKECCSKVKTSQGALSIAILCLIVLTFQTIDVVHHIGSLYEAWDQFHIKFRDAPTVNEVTEVFQNPPKNSEIFLKNTMTPVEFQASLTAKGKESFGYFQYHATIGCKRMEDWHPWQGSCMSHLPNLASYNFGARVIYTSRLFNQNQKQITARNLGIPYPYHNPVDVDIILKEPIEPGNSLTFHGQSGQVIVKLEMKVFIFGFTIHHPPMSTLLSGHIASAPREVEFYGLEENGRVFSFGNFTYDITGLPSQTFHPSVFSGYPIDTVKLIIRSNYNNPLYTCLYKFEVYGTEVNPIPWFHAKVPEKKELERKD